jgi:hypothetical protein
MRTVLLAFALSAVAASTAQHTSGPCDGPAHRQFDFWIGQWEVYDNKSAARVGASLIEKLYGGCALRENWSQPGFAGGSLNIYDAADGKWHQTWVDQSGARREFAGGVTGGKMVLTATSRIRQVPDRPVLVRLTFTPNADGTVRQHSDYSADNGASWSKRYDFLYKPAK